jgi:hypothetical protein
MALPTPPRGAPVVPAGVPQRWQKRAPVVSGAAQLPQAAPARAVPQLEQNRPAAAAPQEGQVEDVEGVVTPGKINSRTRVNGERRTVNGERQPLDYRE